MKYKSYLGLILLVGIIVASCNPSEVFTYKEINFDQETIYLKKLNWGLTGDAQTTAISLSKRNNFDNYKSDYINNGQLELFYNISGDTMIIYTREEFNEPLNWKSKITIKQVILDNPSFMNLYDEAKNCLDKINCVKSF